MRRLTIAMRLSFAAFVGVLVLMCSFAEEGCSLFSADRVVNGVDTAAYGQALIACKEEGKDAGSYAVYERCAKEQDVRFGLASALDGGAR